MSNDFETNVQDADKKGGVVAVGATDEVWRHIPSHGSIIAAYLSGQHFPNSEVNQRDWKITSTFTITIV
jgi:hypothetical protein